MVHGSILGEIDLLPSKHVIAKLLQTALLGQSDKLLQRLFGEEVLAEIEQDFRAIGGVFESPRELLKSRDREISNCSGYS